MFNLPPRKQGIIAILLATILWGMTFAFIKDAVTSTAPFNFLFWRFGIASALLLLISYKKIQFNDRKVILQGVYLGIFLSGTVIFQTIGLQYTTAATASFITGLSVIFVTLIACVIEKKPPSVNIITAVILAICGIGIITLTDGLAINQGDLWVLLCAVCFAIYIVLAGKFSHSGKPLLLTLTQLITVFLLTGILAEATHGVSVPTQSNVWIAILFCAIFASIIAFTLQLRYQKYVSSHTTAIIFAMEPIFATITAAIYLNEQLTIRFLIGAALVFLGVLLSERKIKPKVIPQD